MDDCQGSRARPVLGTRWAGPRRASEVKATGSIEVREELVGTTVADPQDLLVEFSDSFEVVTEPAARLELARQLIANPPKYGPRSGKKNPAAPLPPEVAAEPGVVALDPVGLVIFEGLTLGMDFSDDQPRIFDLELGHRLGYERPRKIRDLIKDLVAGGHITVDDQRPGAGRGPRTAGRHWLTEEEALFVTTQSGTDTARAITRQVVRAFVAARHCRVSNADPDHQGPVPRPPRRSSRRGPGRRRSSGACSPASRRRGILQRPHPLLGPPDRPGGGPASTPWRR